MGFCQGRGTAGRLIMVIVLTSLCVSYKGVFATNYKVGDGRWDIMSYDAWLAGKTFKVGDTVEFVYTSAHNVVQVSKTEYESCSDQGSNSVKTDGDTTYPLSSSETYYFICSVSSHCASGMKIAIPVELAAAVAPAPPPPSATSPANNTTSASPPSTAPPTANTTTSTPPARSAASSPLLLRSSSSFPPVLLFTLGLSLLFFRS